MINKYSNRRRRTTAVLVAFLAVVCVGRTTADTDAQGERDEHLMTPIVIETAKSATLPQLMTKLRSERLIYVGETHTAYGDHLLQLEVLRGMAERPEGLALGVEWFQAPFQPVLDDFNAGKIDEAELLRRSEYYERWRFDYRLYRPIIRFARDRGIPIIALNAARELTDEVSRAGINGLDQAAREKLPDDYDFSDKAYEAQLREMFSLHDDVENDGAQFQRFLEVQLTWDETMAQNVATYLQDNPGGRILVLAGKGHIAGRSGIPSRVTRRTGVVGKTIATFSPAARLFNSADYLILANEQSLPPAGLMRVLLDERDGAVYVKGFTDGSPAEEAGIKEGDQIVSIGGQPIGHYADIKIAMIDRLPGSEITVTVRRERFVVGDITETYTFPLASDRPHG